ncbi:MAG: sigma-70 family RNA polymerase sigma factor [Chloroflexi bacterium]|nr:sigma-70 family RNA polymerase sigma factor [Chloroflexota bacterium]
MTFDALDLPSSDSSQVTDETLVRRMTKGDEDALKMLIERYSGKLCSISRRILGSLSTDQDIEEVLSDSFLRAWYSCRSYESERGSVATWLGRIVFYQALSRRKALLRRDKSLLRLDAESPMCRQYVDEDKVVDKIRLQSAIETLRAESPPDVDIIERRYFKDELTSDIARSLDITPTLARVRLHRALTKLCAVMKRV